MTSKQRFKILMKERGYIVFLTDTPREIGTVTQPPSLSEPLVVVAETNARDAFEQEQVLIKHGMPEEGYYYRLKPANAKGDA
jgi:hypothetical protein